MAVPSPRRGSGAKANSGSSNTRPSSLRDLDHDGDVDLADDPSRDLDRDGRIDLDDREHFDIDNDNDIDASDRSLSNQSVRESLNDQGYKVQQPAPKQGHGHSL